MLTHGLCGVVISLAWAITAARSPACLTANTSAGAVVAVTDSPVACPVAPIITTFMASPSSIAAGQDVVLSWAGTNATSFSIVPDVGTVTRVTPSAATTHTLTATGPGGSVTSGGSVMVARDLAAMPLGAFPGCQGSGCKTRGGFAPGTTVLLVTSLASDTRAGTLGACIAASGPRVCLFRTSGTIDSGGYTIGSGSITIDGRSAPGDGITITSKSNNVASIFVRASDVVVRGLKLRPGFNSAHPGDLSGACGVNITGPSMSNIIFDHNSIQWGNGDQISIWSHGETISDLAFS
jgi:hypothetical protein